MIDENYQSFNDFDSDGSTTEWDISLSGNRPDVEDGVTPYINASDILAVQITLGDEMTSDIYTPLDCAPVDGMPNRFSVTPAAPVGTITRIYRKTFNEYNLVNFNDLNSFSADTLDLAVRQLLFVAQEARDLAMLAMNTNRAPCHCDEVASVCPVFTTEEVVAGGLDWDFGEVSVCDFSTYSDDFNLDGCGIFSFHGSTPAGNNEGTALRIEADSPITVQVQVYTGVYPSITPDGAATEETIGPGEDFSVFFNDDLAHEITIAIQAIDPSQSSVIRARWQSMCS